MFLFVLALLGMAGTPLLFGQAMEVNGNITDPQGRLVPGASIRLEQNGSAVERTTSDQQGGFTLHDIPYGTYTLTAEAPGFAPIAHELNVPADLARASLQFDKLSVTSQSIVITAKSLEPEIDLRNAEVFN